MEQQYSVSIRGNQTGKVVVQRIGLYYRFQCRCVLKGDVPYRLMVTCGTSREDLGILVPIDDGFGLDTRVPVKRIGEGKMDFTLSGKGECRTGKFAPICPEEPFSYMSRLKDSFLTTRNGQPGILIQEKQER